jgi:hypothetical protein
MVLQAGDLGILIDFDDNKPGSVLQRKEDGEWGDNCPDRTQQAGIHAGVYVRAA